MTTSVYLSSGKLDVVIGFYAAGSYHIRGFHTFEIPEELFVRGAISDAAAFSELLNKLWEDNRLPRTGLSLVIGGGLFMNKLFKLPLFTFASAASRLKHEFSDAQHLEAPVMQRLNLSLNLHGYSRSMLGIAAEKSYIRSFYETFTRAGLSLIAIDSDLNAQIRLLRHHPQIKKRSCILLFKQRGEIGSFVFISGVYLYSERSRLSRRENSGDLVSALLRIISALFQFLRVQKLENKLTDVFLSGLGDTLIPQLEESLKQLSGGLKASELKSGRYIQAPEDAEITPEEILNAASGLRLMPGKTGFLSSFITAPDKEPAFKPAFAIPYIAVIVLLLSWWYSLFNQQLIMMATINKLSVLIGDERLSQAAGLYDEYTEKLREAECLCSSAQKAGEAIDSYPLLTSQAAQSIEAAAKPTVSSRIASYEAATGCVSLDCSAKDEWLIHQFIRRLKNNSLIKSVDYSGYFYNEDGSFTIEVCCYLKGA